jgi:hypothetical protein
MTAPRARLNATGEDGLPPAYLLGFDVTGEGDGRVIVASGNPDTADHTSVHVPGTGTGLEGIGGDVERGDTVWRESQALAPGQSVSTVTWFDYDAPDGIPEAVSGSRAGDAGPRLQCFLVLSSGVLDMMAVQGKVTEPGPGRTPCARDDGQEADGLFRVRHPWSLYGLDRATLETAMENLREALPGHGWKVERVGEDASRNRNPELLAVHPRTRSQLEVTLLKGADGHEPLLEVSLYSRCFADPDGAA